MQIQEITFKNVKPVEGYGAGFFRVAGEKLSGPIVLLGDHIFQDVDVSKGDFLLGIYEKVDIVIYGSGDHIAGAPPDLQAKADELGIAIESMTTPTACRTYNMLLAEARRVALAALPIKAE